MITAPVYFKLEAQGFKQLANTADYDDLFAPTVYVFKKSLLASDPGLAEKIIKAHIEGIKRLYEDKAFALKAYIKYNSGEDADDLAKVWERYTVTNTWEKVPYVTKPAVQYMLDHPVDEKTGAQMRSFDYRTVIDNSLIDRLVKEGFFEKLYGKSIQAEQERKAKIAYR